MSTGSKTDYDKFDKQKTLLKTMVVVKKGLNCQSGKAQLKSPTQLLSTLEKQTLSLRPC